MRDGFLLDPDVVYLNHGSYGACPQAVFDEYQRLQRDLEQGPTDFFTPGVALVPGRRRAARAGRGARSLERSSVQEERLVFVPNATRA